MRIEEMKQAVLDKAKQSFEERLFAGTSGNLSMRDPESGLMVITPGSVSYHTMKLEDIMVVTLDGEIREGTRKPSSEWRMHAEIYKHRPDVNGVVHTHSPYATGFAVAHENVPVILIEMMFFLLGDVPVAAYSTPGTPELGANALAVLDRRGACLMENHGVLAIGANLDQAHIRAVYTEDAAKICTIARMNGTVHTMPIEEQNKMRRKMGISEE